MPEERRWPHLPAPACAPGGEVFEEASEASGFRLRHAHDPEGHILEVRGRV